MSACTQLEPAGDAFLVVGTGGSSEVTSSGGKEGPDASLPVATGGSPGSGGAASDGGASSGSGGESEGTGGGSEPDPPPDPGCVDPDGFDGLGCYRCAPTDLTTLENACTTAVCTRFDESARLTRLMPDGTRPALPTASGAGGTPGAGGAASSGGAPSSGGVAASGGTAASGGAPSSVGHECESLRARGHVVYVTGSTAAKPFLQQIAQQVSVQSVFIVYTATGSCTGVDAIVNATPMKTGPAPAPARSATYWDTTTSAGTACDLPAGGVAADLGISDVFAQTCDGFELVELATLGIRDAHGPIQTMAFVVPASSRYSEISAKAAFFAFGFGAESGLLNSDGEPMWNDEAYLIQRSASSGTQAMLAAAIGVSAPRWKGKKTANSDEVLTAINAASATQETADKAIGILAMDYIDTRELRSTVRVLAFQDDTQACAVFPDSTADSKDKQNVRDGHYPIWGPMHLLYRVDATGRPANPDTRDALTGIVGYLSGTKALPNDVKLIDVYAKSGLVPECAMHVRRTRDGGQLFPDVPDSPCSCAFEARATGSTACKRCTVQSDCATDEICSLDYCEPSRAGGAER